MSSVYSSRQFMKSAQLFQLLNALGLLGLSASLAIAFYYQFWRHELPCPLCLLQRIGIISIGFGFLMNIRFGSRGLHYGLSIISAVISGIVSARQMFLHIAPGSDSYGSSLLGLHFYTWGVLASIGVIVFIAVLLIFESFHEKRQETARINTFGKIAITIFTLLIAANLLSVFLECGFSQCPDNPTTYQFLPL